MQQLVYGKNGGITACYVLHSPFLQSLSFTGLRIVIKNFGGRRHNFAAGNTCRVDYEGAAWRTAVQRYKQNTMCNLRE